MKKIILEPTDILKITVGDSIALEISIELAFRMLTQRKKIDNSNTTYFIKNCVNVS